MSELVVISFWYYLLVFAMTKILCSAHQLFYQMESHFTHNFLFNFYLN